MILRHTLSLSLVSMGKVMKLRDLIGAIKDKASASKAMLSKPNTVSLHLSVLRTTNHSPSAPPDEKHLAALLSLGDSSRATASALIESLMDRLHRTSTAAVALKCLLTIHHVIRRGPFILQDQLSVFPAAGGRNYLNLSGFREGATAATWVLSAWVRWYARYLETLLSTSRVIGFFLCSSSSTLEKGLQDDRLSSYLNLDLIGDVHSLATLIDETCSAPDSLLVEGNKILDEVMGLVGGDYLSAVNEILSRLSELNQRLSCLNFDEMVELTRGLKRLEDCRQRLDILFSVKKPLAESLWGLVGELKKGVGMVNVCREGETLASVGRGEMASGSARFHDRVVERGDSVRSSSTRFGFNKLSDRVVERGDSVRSSSARFAFNKLSLMVFDSIERTT